MPAAAQSPDSAVDTDLEARQVANTLAELIIGGSLVSVDIVRPVSDGSEASVSGRSIRQPGTAA